MEQTLCTRPHHISTPWMLTFSMWLILSVSVFVLIDNCFCFYEKKVYTVMINNSTNINKSNNHLSS